MLLLAAFYGGFCGYWFDFGLELVCLMVCYFVLLFWMFCCFGLGCLVLVFAYCVWC